MDLITRTDDREDWEAMIADVCNRPGTWSDDDDDDDDDDDYVHVFDPMGDKPLFLLILLVFMVIISLILLILFSFIKASLGMQTEKSHLLGPSFKLMNL